MARQISCPTCSRPIQWTEAYPYRPFCSERCRLIDLGGWLTEKNAIPGDPPSSSEEWGGTEGDDDSRDGGHGRA